MWPVQYHLMQFNLTKLDCLHQIHDKDVLSLGILIEFFIRLKRSMAQVELEMPRLIVGNGYMTKISQA
jgi:hypothetical protein